jgi:UTP--glucose-1-phosphate uridylyltransferase
MIRKVVIPAAGLGTRLFPATKEQPKEMLPIFSRLANDDIGIKPLLQIVFEQLYEANFRSYCFVVGRGKRSIEDNFTPDYGSLLMLKDKGMTSQAADLSRFYEKLKTSTIFWVNQPEPKGFGDAVLLSRPFVQDEAFLVHAGDTYIISNNAEHISRLVDAHERLNGDATFLVEEVENPEQYGVIEGDKIESDIFKVKHAIEKPERPTTKLAIVAIYLFDPVIFKALEKTRPGRGGEVQLTDAIQTLIEWDLNVYAVKLDTNTRRLDIGSPETYWEALASSYQSFHKGAKE